MVHSRLSLRVLKSSQLLLMSNIEAFCATTVILGRLFQTWITLNWKQRMALFVNPILRFPWWLWVRHSRSLADEKCFQSLSKDRFVFFMTESNQTSGYGILKFSDWKHLILNVIIRWDSSRNGLRSATRVKCSWAFSLVFTPQEFKEPYFRLCFKTHRRQFATLKALTANSECRKFQRKL